MRLIENQCLESMASPIRWIFFNLHEAIVNVAPEKSELFDITHSDFILEYLDTTDRVFNVNREKKHIKISKSVVELLWCISYAICCFYTKTIQGKLFVNKETIDLNDDPQVANALELMRWAINNCINPSQDKPWPIGFPEPTLNPPKNSLLEIANELCLCATAFLIHHELAHIRLKHNPGINIDQEREADYEAADWILGGIEKDDVCFTKRALGISLALIASTATGIYTDDYGGKTHPRKFDRLFNVLTKYDISKEHLVYAISSMAINLFLQHKNNDLDLKEYDDFLSFLDDLVEHMSAKSAN